MPAILTSILLLISSLASAAWLLHQHKNAKVEHHYRVRVLALSFVFIGAYALGQVVFRDPNNHTSTFIQMTENLAIYVSLPFIATVFVAVSKGWHWSMAGWGRWLLGLIAFFELTRQTDVGVSYSYTLSLLVLAALLLSCIATQSLKSRLLLFGGTLFLGAGTLLFSPIPLLMNEGNTPLFVLLLAISLPLLTASYHLRVVQSKTD